MNQEVAGQTPDKRGRKRALWAATALFLLIAAACAAAYFLLWQNEESTDDAYVAAHLMQITPQTAGTVQEVRVDDTAQVKAGDVLVVLDDSDYRLAYEAALNELVQAVRANRQQQAAAARGSAEVAVRRADLAKAQDALRRRESLAGTDAVSGEEISQARAAVEQANSALKAAQAAETAAQAAIGSRHTPLREQPAVRLAVSKIKAAWLNLQRTQIRAPAAGQVAKRNVQTGQTVAAGMPLMAVVPLDEVWVDVNFKEVQLARLRVGQTVELESDVYGGKVKYRGKVAGLSAGTGSAFSVLPPQNATGNWIKVVQRVPVRIELDKQQLKQHPLRVGLSMSVRVDVSDESGKALAEAVLPQPSAAADKTDWSPVEQEIEALIAQHGR